MKKQSLYFIVGLSIFLFAFRFERSLATENTPIEIHEILDTTKHVSIEDTKVLPCVQMFNSIEKHSKKYNIPAKYAYGIAYHETRYDGPFHWSYDHAKTSSAGAVGPMQIKYRTAKAMLPEKVKSVHDLKNDIDLNIECSMKLLNVLYQKYGNWKLVFGAYSTGKPVVNGYSHYVFNFKPNL